MKLRIRGNSIRLRLTKTEIQNLIFNQFVEEQIEFGLNPLSQLKYVLDTSLTVGQPLALIDRNLIRVTLPQDMAMEFAKSDQVSLESFQEISEGKSLRILVEKDFACLKERPHEDDSDAFPHPSVC